MVCYNFIGVAYQCAINTSILMLFLSKQAQLRNRPMPIQQQIRRGLLRRVDIQLAQVSKLCEAPTAALAHDRFCSPEAATRTTSELLTARGIDLNWGMP